MLKKLLLSFFTISLILTLYQPLKSENTLQGKVVGISDGDTIIVLDQNKKSFKIRLYGIDCPEMSQPYGMKAKQFTSGLVFNKDVKVTTHGQDRYGRIIGEIYINSLSLNRELVRNGLAWWYKQYSPKDIGLKTLEQDARTNKRGLWADPNPIAPWRWRIIQKSKKRIIK